MKRARDEILQASRLREVLLYDPDTGLFVWRIGRKGTPKGSIAGNRRRDRRVYIGIDKVRYMAHRLAWLYMTGAFPDSDMDHIDCDPSNNQFDNLRLATFSQNQRNQGTPKHNTSGFKGVTWFKLRRKWRAQIKIKGKVKHLGLFPTPDEAHQAYCKAASEAEPQFARFK